MTDLKSCPFCGSEAKITDTEPYAVECTNDGCQIDGPCHGSKSDAIAAWNRRASSVQAEPVAVECVPMTDWSRGYAQPADPIWRIVLDGYCADFPTETAARNFADAIIRSALVATPPADERVVEQDGELAAVREALEELAGEIESQRDAITHPHGQRAHFIDSQDQIRVDVLTDILDRAGVALGGTK